MKRTILGVAPAADPDSQELPSNQQVVVPAQTDQGPPSADADPAELLSAAVHSAEAAESEGQPTRPARKPSAKQTMVGVGVPPEPSAEDPSAAWHEPGRWNAGPESEDDEVTVALGEKEAEQILADAGRPEGLADADDDDEITRAIASPYAESQPISDFPPPLHSDDDDAITRAVASPLEDSVAAQHPAITPEDARPAPADAPSPNDPFPSAMPEPNAAVAAPAPPAAPASPADTDKGEPADYEDALFGTGSRRRSKASKKAEKPKRRVWPWLLILVILLIVAGVIAVFGWQRPAGVHQFLESRLPQRVQDTLVVAARSIGAPGPAPTDEALPDPVPPTNPTAMPELSEGSAAPSPAAGEMKEPQNEKADAGTAAEAGAAAEKDEAGSFDSDAAKPILQKAADEATEKCKDKSGPSGTGKALITFAPSGRATQVTLPQDFAMTDVGECVAEHFIRTRVPAFEGRPQIVSKYFTVP